MSICETCRHTKICPCYDPTHDVIKCRSFQPKPTRYERIMAEMTPEKLAETRIDTDLCVNDGLAAVFWLTDAGRFSEYADAIAAEIAWLKEVDE